MSIGIDISEIFSIIESVDTPYKLIAFTLLIGMLVFFNKLSRKERLLRETFKKDRKALLSSEFDLDEIKSDDLTKKQRYSLKIANINSRKENIRIRYYSTVIIIIFALLIFLAIVIFNDASLTSKPKLIGGEKKDSLECPQVPTGDTSFECLFK